MAGYAQLSLLMGEFPSVAIFKRYATLNAQNILYLQAKLENLECRLLKFAAEDENSSSSHRQLYSKDWFSLKESLSPRPEEGSDSRQWKTFMEIKETLREYSRFRIVMIVMI